MTDGRWQKIAIQTAPNLEPYQSRTISASNHINLEPYQRRIQKNIRLDQGYHLMH